MSTYGAHRQGTIYYALGNHGGVPRIKIGITGNLGARMHALGLHALATHPGSGATESDLHRRFAASALGGEWFKPSIDLLVHIASFRDEGIKVWQKKTGASA